MTQNITISSVCTTDINVQNTGAELKGVFDGCGNTITINDTTQRDIYQGDNSCIYYRGGIADILSGTFKNVKVLEL